MADQIEETEIKEDIEFKEETELTQPPHFIHKRRASNIISEYDMDESFQQYINAHSRELRMGLVSIILLAWASLMIPYDIAGSDIHADFVNDRTIFSTSLYLWLVGHCCVVLCSLLCIFTLKYCKSNPYLVSVQLILMLIAPTLQVIGAVLFAYSFCVNERETASDILWGACISKVNGLYLLYNSSFISYLGFIIFATRYDGRLPLLSFLFQDCCSNNYGNTDNPVLFSKNFRVSFLSIISLIGMSLILVFGFHLYDNVGPSYQAIYIGYTFILIGTSMIIFSQIIFHCNWCKKKDKYQRQMERFSNLKVDSTQLLRRMNINESMRRNNSSQACTAENVEHILHLLVYFFIMAAIVIIFLYSLVSKIPEAQIIIERMRLIGNMVMITGTGMSICYELYAKSDNYTKEADENEDEYEYIAIPDR